MGNRYVVNLNRDLDGNIKEHLRNKECEIFYDDLIPNQIVIETIQDMECLSSFDFVKVCKGN